MGYAKQKITVKKTKTRKRKTSSGGGKQKRCPTCGKYMSK